MTKIASLVPLLALVTVTGCATVRGMGDDARSLGQGIKKTVSGGGSAGPAAEAPAKSEVASQDSGPSEVLGNALVRRAQERLKAEGFDPGPLDGVLGRKTESALRQYQAARGLSSTGKLDGPTRNALKL